MTVSSQADVPSHHPPTVAPHDALWSVAVQLDTHYEPNGVTTTPQAGSKRHNNVLRQHVFPLPMASISSWATAQKSFEDAINPDVISTSDSSESPVLRRVVVVGFGYHLASACAQEVLVINELQWATYLRIGYDQGRKEQEMTIAKQELHDAVLYVRLAGATAPQPSELNSGQQQTTSKPAGAADPAKPTASGAGSFGAKPPAGADKANTATSCSPFSAEPAKTSATVPASFGAKPTGTSNTATSCSPFGGQPSDTAEAIFAGQVLHRDTSRPFGSTSNGAVQQSSQQPAAQPTQSLRSGAFGSAFGGGGAAPAQQPSSSQFGGSSSAFLQGSSGSAGGSSSSNYRNVFSGGTAASAAQQSPFSFTSGGGGGAFGGSTSKGGNGTFTSPFSPINFGADYSATHTHVCGISPTFFPR